MPSTFLRIAARDVRPVLREAFGRGWKPLGFSRSGHLCLMWRNGRTITTGVHGSSPRLPANIDATLRAVERQAAATEKTR